MFQSRKKKLQKLQLCQIQTRLLEIGVKEINGKKDTLIQRLLEFEKFKHRIKRLLEPTLMFLTGAVISSIIGNFVSLPIYKNQQNEFGNKILQWDQKDERIRNVYRISKSLLSQSFPFGYKVFATNPMVFSSENDSIFSDILKSQLDDKVIFKHSENKVFIKVEENLVSRFNKNFVQEGNIFETEINIPPIGYYLEFNSISAGISLYFGMLDNTRNDEIYVFGYREIGPIKEHQNYKPHDSGYN